MLVSPHDLSGLVELLRSFSSLWFPISYPRLSLFKWTPKQHATKAFLLHHHEASSSTISATQTVSTALPHSLSVAADTPIPYGCVHHAFLFHASTRPQQTAVIDHVGQSLSYGALDAFSLRVASFLRSSGVQRGRRVCLLVHRSIAQVIGIFGVLRAGAAYIPLDGDVITDHALMSVLEDAQPAFILMSKKCLQRVAIISSPFACLEDVILELEDNRPALTDDLLDDIVSSDGAYVIYTSGTTGKPKGVAVSHLNVTNLLCLFPGNLGITPGIHVAQLLNVAFDMCAWETLGCLMNGGTLCLRGPRRADWLKVLEAVHVVICTPSILSQHDPHNFTNIRVIATAGEPCPQSLADSWARQAAFYNCCGPTEVTIVNTMSRHVAGTPLSIGRPTPNNSVYILDEDMHPVPAGVSGVMWAGGLGVCQGYLNRPDLNRTKFAKDPFSHRGALMYNTGDIGRRRADGSIEHLGRIDEQVKVKGFRVELDGVTAAMRTCPAVTSACALLIGAELWGFYSPEDIGAEQVQHAAAQIQPYYAVPTKYKAVSAIPLTSNGKIDKQALHRMVEGECGN